MRLNLAHQNSYYVGNVIVTCRECKQVIDCSMLVRESDVECECKNLRGYVDINGWPHIVFTQTPPSWEEKQNNP